MNRASDLLFEIRRHVLNVVVIAGVLCRLGHDLTFVLSLDDFVAARHQVAASQFFRHGQPPIRGAYHALPLLRSRADYRPDRTFRLGRILCAGAPTLDVYLVDGTYELFRHFHALPSARDAEGREVAAVRGVLTSVLALINGGVTHVAVATDHVIESFRNDLWPGYKTGEGIDSDLLSQFPLLEDALTELGVVVWPMIEFEADDALAAGAVRAAEDPRVDRVVICTPDKDLSQTVSGTRIVQLNRRTRIIRDEAGVVARFGVPPVSIPDYLALVGDAADGYPGLAGWGAKSTAAVLARFGHLEHIPTDSRTWGVNAANPAALARTLHRERDRVFLFRQLATLRTDLPLFDDVEELRWGGPMSGFAALAARLEAADIAATIRP